MVIVVITPAMTMWIAMVVVNKVMFGTYSQGHIRRTLCFFLSLSLSRPLVIWCDAWAVTWTAETDWQISWSRVCCHKSLEATKCIRRVGSALRSQLGLD